MPTSAPNRLPGANGPASRFILTAAVSVLFTLTASRPTDARDILRGGTGIAPASGASNTGNAANAAAAQAAAIAQRANDTLTRTAQALQDLKTAQAKARAIAAAGANNLGKNPNNTSQQLPDVPNGLVDDRSKGGAGGLIPDSGIASDGVANPVTTWSGAGAPVQATDASGKIGVTIKQNLQQAFLNWQTFNIGKNTTLTFDQSAGGADIGTWIAFNKINDPSGVPSQILGSIKAGGQVYLINQNGIIFGGSSQVNTHALVASSLPINDNLVSLGLINNPDLQFLFSSLPIAKLSGGTMDPFTPTITAPGGVCGDVTVQAGADLESPTTADHVGGKIALIGSNVTNAGVIYTPDGQTILAAGQQVAFTSHNSSDPTLRGLDVYVGQGGGIAENTAAGIIDVPRGDISMVGRNVNQLGYTVSTTSVSLNGRIDLLANYNTTQIVIQNKVCLYPNATGLVSLGAGSVTQILPELTSSDKVVGSQLALSSKIFLQGNIVYFGADSILSAPNGDVAINAGTWQPTATDPFINNSGQVYLDTGAVIDVAGSENITASVTDNIVSAQLRGTELANSPSQRNGILRGQTVLVDARQSGTTNGTSWVGTPLADVSGWINLIQNTVGELTVSGGSVAINAGDSFVMRNASRIDVSGGWINYTGGNIKTTKVVSGSHIYDISQATADLVYDNIYAGFSETHSRWNVSQTFTSPLLNGAHFEQGYIQGGAAGSLAITAPSMALDGEFYGNQVVGPRQHANAPANGVLSLVFENQDATTLLAASPTPPSVLFQSGVQQAAADDFSIDASGNAVSLRPDRKAQVILSPDILNENGFGTFTLINSDGTVTLAAGEKIEAPSGGVLAITGANIDIEGTIHIPAGTLSLAAYDTSLFNLPNIVNAYSIDAKHTTLPQIDLSRGRITLGSKAALDVSGLVIDDHTGSPSAGLTPTARDAFVTTNAQDGVNPTTTLVKEGGEVVTVITTTGGKSKIVDYLATKIVTSTLSNGKASTTVTVDNGTSDGQDYVFSSLTTSAKDGGSVSIAGLSVNLSQGSSIDVSGGLAIAGNGKRTYGKGGGITVSAGEDPIDTSILGGSLVFNSLLTGYGGYGVSGGSLSVTAPLIQIGGGEANTDALCLSTDFFGQGGFSSFSLSGIGEKVGQGDNYLTALTIAPGTILKPEAQSRLAIQGLDQLEWQYEILDEGIRPPVNLAFSAPGVKDYFAKSLKIRGEIVMGEGSVIWTDALANVSLSGNTVALLGSIYAPGGSISVSGATNSKTIFASNLMVPTVDIGPQSVLSVKGCTLLTPNARGYRTGSLLPGGSISLTGNIVAEAGALLDVSGASGELDKLVTYVDGDAQTFGSLKGQQYERTTVESNGGTLTLSYGQVLVSNATLLGNPGGTAAQGGSLIIAPKLTMDTPLVANLMVSQSAPLLSTSFYPAGSNAIGHSVLDINGNTLADGNTFAGVGYFGADSFNAHGFDSLTLAGAVQFVGPVTLDAPASLNIAAGGVMYADSVVNFLAPYVMLGTAFQAPQDASSLQSPIQLKGAPFAAPASYGSGSLNVSANLIDIGWLSLQNIGTVHLDAAGGDIRGDGVLDVAGDITLTAGQIYPATGVQFTIGAYDHNGIAGSVTLKASGERNLPLSAGGILNIYGSKIIQSGVLRAPLGTINMGWDGTGTAPTDLLAGGNFGKTQSLTLTADSIASVSAIDPITNQAITIPYGLNLNGDSWISPTGSTLSASDLPTKAVNLSAQSIDAQAGSTIDIRGGGDLLAYQFVKGAGGTIDILGSSKSFAVISGYQADYAPYGAYNNNASTAANFGSDTGYLNSTLKVGDRVYLDASPGLAAGYYTLLPARYALLSGAFLVTPTSGVPTGIAKTSDGAYLTSGYRYNDLNPSENGQRLFGQFEVASSTVLANRALYTTYSANTYFDSTASAGYLPKSSGRLLLQATQAMNLSGSVLSKASDGGMGGMVDIASPVEILIGSAGAAVAQGKLFLDASQLSSFGAASLLVGGKREADGSTIDVITNSLTVDNSGSPLAGTDIILVANTALALRSGADIESSGALPNGAADLLLGNPDVAGSGNGLLLRVSADPAAQVARSGVDASVSHPLMTIGAGAVVKGQEVILDSTYGTFLDPSASLAANAAYLNSYQISILLGGKTLSDLRLTNGHPTAGLTLAGDALDMLIRSSASLSLLSYSSIDIYGSGDVGNAAFQSLALHASDIRGFDVGTATFTAQNILLDNSANGPLPGAVDSQSASLAGTLVFNANKVSLGSNQIQVDLLDKVFINAASSLTGVNTGGFLTKGTLTITTPLVTGATGSKQTITSETGVLSIIAPNTGPSTIVGRSLGASLTLTGLSIDVSSMLDFSSGNLTLHATNQDVVVSSGGYLNVAGTEKQFFDVTKYTSGGQISLIADQGSVRLESASTVNVAARAGAGDAGSVTVSVPTGFFEANGSLLGQGGANGLGGTFALDVASIALDNNGHASLAPLDALLNKGGFSEARTIRLRGGDAWVQGLVKAHQYNLSTDGGSIIIAGNPGNLDATALLNASGAVIRTADGTAVGTLIDASGDTGGSINLAAHGSILLEQGSLLTVAAQDFDAAGKGGSIALQAATLSVNAQGKPVYDSSAVINVMNGSQLDLSVASNSSESASLGEYTGTVLLRSHQTASATISGALDVQIAPISGTILNASKIVVEGYQEYVALGGSIDSVEAAVSANGNKFVGNNGSPSAGYNSMLSRLAGGANTPLASQLIIEPGAEIINATGDLTLSSDWDFSGMRFGPRSAPGNLTLRAAGNLVFNASLSDGFGSSDFQAYLLQENPNLPSNAQSWSYRLVAGADFTAADFRQVRSLTALKAAGLEGNLELGQFCTGYTVTPYYLYSNLAYAIMDAMYTLLPQDYQVIRTGSGDIDVYAGGNVQLQNQFATIYTAGTGLDDPTMGGAFDVPQMFTDANRGPDDAMNQIYPAQYSRAGGNVTVYAQNDIVHLRHAFDSQGKTIEVSDSSRELPTNWLYRRGYYVNGSSAEGYMDDSSATTWWVDFSNFFEGIGTLGGGNARVTAGRDISNIDVLAATNARMPSGVPDATKLVELGGGDVTVTAGHDINGGVYYVERGAGKLEAGNTIELHSDNYTRSPNMNDLGIVWNSTLPNAMETWLPTTLFLGKGSFDVEATGDVTLGPVANPFLLPQGFGNTYWYKTYFSTYATTDAVNVSSLAGDVTLRESAALPESTDAINSLGVQNAPLLLIWLENEILFTRSPNTASYFQPWLQTVETNMTPFATAVALMPASLETKAFSGDINIVGDITLSPSPTGSLNLLASGAISGLQVNGESVVKGKIINTWATSTINLSDADPSLLPGITNPYSYRSRTITYANRLDTQTGGDFLANVVDKFFDESGATALTDSHLVLQARQALHASGLLHLDDDEPVRLYADSGDLSSLTLFSAKETRIMAANDIYDIAFFLQNDRSSDVSVVAAGGDITAYDSVLTNNYAHVGADSQTGDIQINGPGALEVLAGRTLDLGANANLTNGTGLGITSIGNLRNPYLPFAGADILAAAGINATGLDSGNVDFSAFTAAFLNPSTSGDKAARYLPDLRDLMASLFPDQQVSGMSNAQVYEMFDALPQDRKKLLALDIFYLVLRDAGRDYRNSSSAGYMNYNEGYTAIKSLFPGAQWSGDISLASREIKTKSGGDINLLIPGGKLTVGYNVIGAQSLDQGILTEHGGNISIFARNSVIVGTSRIFTLRGGNEIIWSTLGDIAAGSSSKTVQSAPPTRVLIDPQSANVTTDLAGLATGGGIGTLQTVSGIAPADIALIAPSGAVDAGDAGIRASGNLTVAAAQVLNASNIQVGGVSTGTPAAASVNLGGLQMSVQSTANTNNAANEQREAAQRRADAQQQEALPSLITVEVVGYGGGEGE